ncbi:LOW QUALITY PROTEIN: olfactory receptor 1002-like [Onychomys torridus]|uniref:LOW QUALITY PROTEIN: olfactory receptor 1002-like n=1 Tax=Onychomys torridus TaxID=38674 RepID=UPI00167FB081|nr:LOW QUALITY PROTEIN: olfactory receptor 1002-like [Onychomys torridus]
MKHKNQTVVTELFFTGLTSSFQLQIILFLIFLCVYLLTLLGNLGMIILIRLDTRLHIPMYFLLSHLSFVDACSSSFISPKMLSGIFVEKKAISFLGCAIQLCLFSQFVVTECFLLASMAYDRYVAVCKPLLYTLIMSQQVCVQLVIGPYGIALISTMVHTTFTFILPYCGPNIINHFFCDVLPVFSLACADTQVNKLLFYILAGILGVFSGMIILVSYIYIVITILKIHSADGRRKAFSTCSSYLTAVSILYGTLFFIYVCPSTSFSLDINKVVSLFYTTVIPMLNPFIYSLRNKEVKDAFIRKFEKQFCYNLRDKIL